MSNTLQAIMNIAQIQTHKMISYHSEHNRMNSMGETLEAYIKDAFANCISETDKQKKMVMHKKIFSWLGNQNNPPDAMIRGGDAIEVKKIENENADLALNSSYPKHTLRADNPMINKKCRTCEDWVEKDIIYCIGYVDKDDTKILKSLWLVYGSIYAADPDIYERMKLKIIKGIKEIPDIELSNTKEIARVNRVDPLGITNLRIRGMWTRQNPNKVFDYLFQDKHCNFKLIAVIPTDKYWSFDEQDIKDIENTPHISISDNQVHDPNNPANLISVKLITFTI